MISSKDVAKLAGVSQATVSRVMNNPESVKLETRTKVLAAMEQLSYKPNLIARSLITNSTRTIALISGSLKNGFFVETTDMIVNLATKQGYKTMVFFDDGANSKEIFPIAMGNKVDGILLSSIGLDDPLLKEIENSGIPYMFFNRRPRNGGNYVVLQNVLAGEMMTHHLLDYGHERIAYVSGQMDYSTFYERKLGFETAMQAAGCTIDPELVILIETTAEEVEKATWDLLQLKNPPTAIFYATDMLALIGMDTVMSMGLRVPEDISIGGIDDIKMSAHHAVQLTSVAHQKFLIGQIAVETLIRMIEEGDKVETPQQIVLQPELVLRKTTARRK